MIEHVTHVRVRYADTDQMGYVYYGKYAEYFEVGRVELIRSLGISYREIEDRGIMLPVASLEIHYLSPALYDELLTIKTIIPEIPRSSLLTEYEVIKPDQNLAVKGKVKLAFIDKNRMRPVRAPEYMLEAICREGNF